MHVDSPPPGMLLIVRHESGSTRSGERISLALAGLACVPVSGSSSTYQLRLVNGWSEALRELACACSSDGDSAWLVAELPPASSDGGPYRRMHDRSADFAEGLTAWRTANAPFPTLEPGDMVRL